MIAWASLDGLLVDEVDMDLYYGSKWSVGTTGYARRGEVAAGGQRREGRLHRIIGERLAGRPLLKTEEIDHINGNPLDNRRSNLRLASHRENLRNQQNRRKGISDYVGVSPIWNKWRAYLVLDNKQIHVGMFDSRDEAAWMRDQFALQLHGEFARLNFDYEAVA